MSRRIQTLVVLLMMSLLAACATTQPRSYSFHPPTDDAGRSCVSSCHQSQRACNRSCNPGSYGCMKVAHEDYMRYQDQQISEGNPVERSLESFYHDRKCKIRDCGCDADFRSCYELCGGKVLPKM